ncbi:MAG: potassium channel family protein [Phycisphaerae bacterium]
MIKVKQHIDWENFLVNKYNHLLVTLVLLLVFSPTLSAKEQEYKFPVISLILMIVLIAAMRTNFPHGKFLNFFLGVVAIGFVLNLCVYYMPREYQRWSDYLSFTNQLLTFFFFALTVYMLSRSLFRTHQVSQDTIKGAVCAYLLLGFLWSILYSLCEKVFPGSFISLNSEDLRYVYFSFTTLTTVGYGDIVPVGQFASVLTNIEALSGQIFLAIFVARLVGIYIAAEMKEHHKN